MKRRDIDADLRHSVAALTGLAPDDPATVELAAALHDTIIFAAQAAAHGHGTVSWVVRNHHIEYVEQVLTTRIRLARRPIIPLDIKWPRAGGRPGGASG